MFGDKTSEMTITILLSVKFSTAVLMNMKFYLDEALSIIC